MACDRFLYWQNGRRPTHKQLMWIIEDFLGETMINLIHQDSLIVIKLHGTPTAPLSRMVDAIKNVPLPGERHIEIFLHGRSSIDIITRQADEYTMVVADGLLALLKRFYDATGEEDE